MKTAHIFSRLLLALLTLAFTAFLALAISAPSSSAGMGFMKRGDDSQADGNANRDRDGRQAREDRDRQDRDRQANAERERQADRDRQARADRDKQDRDRQANAERDRQADRDRQARADRDKQQQERQAQVERERQVDRDRQARENRDRQDRSDREKQDRDRQDRADRDKQQQERQANANAERERQADRERQARADQERPQKDRQAQAERERQAEKDRVARVERENWQASNVRSQRSNSSSNRPQRSGYEAPKKDNPKTNSRVEVRRDTRDSNRSGVGGVFDRSKRGDSRRDSSPRVETRTPAARPDRRGEVRSDRPSNRPQRTDQIARPSNSRSRDGDRSFNGRRTERVFTRVYETRRDWRVHYPSYDHRHRPSFNGGFFYYGPARYDPYYYGYYCFSYVPRYTYPSLYFHYGTFPYLYSDRLIFRHYPVRRYVYVPLYVYDDDVFYRPYFQPYPGYYLSTSNRRELRDTLDDIQEAWERGDYDLIMRRVNYSERVDVFFQEKYEYSVGYEDFRDMTRDAMETMDTISFEFTKVRMRDRDQVVAYGQHKYYDDDDQYSTVNVTYTLERHGDQWYITETGSSPRSNSRF